jgi:hypothetical protein
LGGLIGVVTPAARRPSAASAPLVLLEVSGTGIAAVAGTGLGLRPLSNAERMRLDACVSCGEREESVSKRGSIASALESPSASDSVSAFLRRKRPGRDENMALPLVLDAPSSSGNEVSTADAGCGMLVGLGLGQRVSGCWSSGTVSRGTRPALTCERDVSVDSWVGGGRLTSSLPAAPENTLSRETRSDRETGKEKERDRGAMVESGRSRRGGWEWVKKGVGCQPDHFGRTRGGKGTERFAERLDIGTEKVCG